MLIYFKARGLWGSTKGFICMETVLDCFTFSGCVFGRNSFTKTFFVGDALLQLCTKILPTRNHRLVFDYLRDFFKKILLRTLLL